ncbi:hypothetical protein BGAL_0027g00390 [Botrytis galanthina]|uniref:FAS1 domain-containing protein n=1 Tax=Botrytis galanthina TaxID=278940 RepID=A0A4S8R8N7_9HELO|nr:hypothetical protein BGAL_0027g00390 [Botrytis galanthina]
MKYTPSISFLLTVFFAATISGKDIQGPLPDNNLGPAMPPKSEPSSDPIGGGDTIILSDVLGRDRSINIFAGFTRDIAPISERFADGGQNTTILAPVNSAIMALPRKPWEDPEDYDKLGANAYEGEDGEERAHKNLRRFVEAHIVPVSPWKEGEKVKTLVGDEVWWENKDGVKRLQPGNIEVSSMAGDVHNGQVWILKNVRNYA